MTRSIAIAPLIVGCAQFMHQFDGAVIATALPAMAQSLGEDPVRLNLAITCYLLSLHVFQPGPTTRAQAIARLFDPPQKAWIVFHTVIEPVVFRLKANQDARGFAMARDDDLLRFSLAQIPRQIVFDFRQRNFLHSRSAN